MNVQVICSETVKPSSPTPHLRKYSLSLCDQLIPASYVPVILYYHNEDKGTITTSEEKIRLLKSSLSILLARFYPFAGRIEDNLSITCSDEGVDFLEAKVDRELSEVLACPDPRELRKLLPIEMESANVDRVHPLVVQANSFQCGALALAICISHKVADATTLASFIASWVNLAVDPESFPDHPLLNASTIFPPLSHLHGLPHVDFPNYELVTQRYVLDSEKVSTLVELANSEQATRPTRVEAVSALLWGCVTRASGRQRSVLVHAMDLRRRLSPPITDTTVGNVATVFATEMREEIKGEVSGFLRKLTAEFREKKYEFLENMVKKRMAGETASAALSETFEAVGGIMNGKEVDLYIFSSWMRLSPYEADFGWGKPIWVSLVKWHFTNTIILMDGRERNGMEVWVTLKKDHMAELDRDEELPRFTSLNPGISW
ncbi:hypothetical protein MLD38_025475 [Melastoma candidum]|nr:hypothetical protein MLD38_025475 [Melastoma candidum]